MDSEWPSSLEVIIDYGEEDRKEKKAKLLRSVKQYGPYGPMAEYETTEGEKFWIVIELLIESRKNHTLPVIPYEVIRKQREITQKLAWGQQRVNDQQKQKETGLILPDGVSV